MCGKKRLKKDVKSTCSVYEERACGETIIPRAINSTSKACKQILHSDFFSISLSWQEGDTHTFQVSGRIQI